VVANGSDPVDAIAFDAALGRLAALDARQAHVVELKCFGGLEMAEIASVLAVSESTVKRDWMTARLWMQRELSGRLD
jgi:DNA-directed RNA polymerase specialized sigma24 family protein